MEKLENDDFGPNSLVNSQTKHSLQLKTITLDKHTRIQKL